MSFKVTDKDIQNYTRDGAVVIRGLFSPEEIQWLVKGIETNISAPSWRSKVASNSDDPGWFMEDFCTWQDNPAYRRIIEDSSLASVAAQLMKSQEVRLFHDHMLVKEPGYRTANPVASGSAVL